MTTYITAKPAYARTLKTKAEVQAYFEENKDFEITDVGRDEGRKVSKSCLPPDHKLEVSYGVNRDKTVILP